MEKKTKRDLITMAVLFLLPTIIVVAEFQSNWFERVVGSYLESNNDSRERLAKFVEQDARSEEATKAVQNLITRKDDGEEENSEPEAPVTASAVRLNKGHRLVMTRSQFRSVHQKLSRIGKSIAQAKVASRMPWSSEWERTILTRPGWIQKGTLYFVDADNSILSEAPLSAESYDLLDVYALGIAEDSPFNQGKVRVFGPKRFYTALRRMPSTVRDQIIPPGRLPSLEAASRRVGLGAVGRNDKADLMIETSVQDYIEVVSIKIPGLIRKELIARLDDEAR